MSKKIEKFEDFIAWQKARQLSRKIYQATNLPGFARDFGLKDQIRRYVAFDANYLSRSQFSDLMFTATEVGQVIGGLRVAVEKRKASA